MDQPFDRSIINVRERPVSSDINELQTEIDHTIREVFESTHGGRTSNSDDTATPMQTSFIGESFKIKPLASPAMAIRIRPGLGFFYNPTDLPNAIGGVPGMNDADEMKPLPLNNEQQITVPSNVSGNPRIDIVEVTYNRLLADSSSRDVLNATTGVFAAQVIQKTLSWILDNSLPTPGPGSSTTGIGYKTGTPSGSPVAPATTSGYVKIAEILVPNSATSITQGDIKDLRSLSFPYNCFDIATEVTVNATGAVSAAMNKLVAPAGCQVVVVETSSTNATCDVYVFMGNPSASLPVISLSAQQSGAGVASGVTSAPSLTTIGSGDVTEITGSGSTTPGYVPALGQPVYKFSIAFTPGSTAAVTYSIGIQGNGF